ncbi:D-3-phosphoglycerate dehydrogenase [Geomicrobium sp. JCM 19037]|nr:D-3-phosphoglycerate dehydrogenase [Geomicrobium sp. JCM 19037]
MPVSFPLKGLDNVLLTPHMAAHTEDSMRAMAVGAAEAIVRELISEKGEDS